MALTSRRAVASPLQVTALPPLEGVTVMSTVASLLVKSKL